MYLFVMIVKVVGMGRGCVERLEVCLVLLLGGYLKLFRNIDNIKVRE